MRSWGTYGCNIISQCICNGFFFIEATCRKCKGVLCLLRELWGLHQTGACWIFKEAEECWNKAKWSSDPELAGWEGLKIAFPVNPLFSSDVQIALNLSPSTQHCRPSLSPLGVDLEGNGHTQTCILNNLYNVTREHTLHQLHIFFLCKINVIHIFTQALW